MTFSKGLKAKYLIEDKTDEEICSSSADLTEKELSINYYAWHAIVKANKRAEILEIIEDCKSDHNKLIELELLNLEEINLKFNEQLKQIYV